jgi:arylsulfatase A-like enzyme
MSTQTDLRTKGFFRPALSIYGLGFGIALAVGVGKGVWLTLANGYLNDGLILAAVKVLVRGVDGAMLIGFGLATTFAVAVYIVAMISKSIDRAVGATLFGALAVVLSAAGSYAAVRLLLDPGQLPFFCRDEESFWAFFHRLMLLRLQPVSTAELIAGFGAALTVFTLAIYALFFRNRCRAVRNWSTMLSASPRNWCALFLTVLAAVFALHAASLFLGKSVATVRPNILLVSVDTLRADALGFAGSDARTPNLDKLAGRGAWFENAYAPSPWTLPSHGSLLTSLIPGRIPLSTVKHKLPRRVTTLAEVLEAQGYQTGAVVNHLFASSAYGFDQGFSSFELLPETPAPLQGAAHLAGKFLSKAKSPWFCFVHIYAPHWPYAPVKEGDLAMYDGADRAMLAEAADYYQFILSAQNSTEKGRQRLVRAYHDEVEAVDDELGRLFSLVEAADAKDGTVIAVTSDHGDAFGEKGAFGHGYLLDQEVLRIPLVLAWGDRLGRAEALPMAVDLLDVAPTLLSLAGVAIPEQFQGRDLGPSLRNEPLPGRTLVSQTALTDQPATSVIDGVWKYSESHQVRFRDVEFFREEALRQLFFDPMGRDNVIAANREIAGRLSRIASQIPDGLDGDGPGAALTEAETENLRSLGYLQ